MTARRLVAAALLAGIALVASAAPPLALPAPPQAGLVQNTGAALPLQMPLRDEAGQPVRLGDYFEGDRPVLLVLGYYRCPQLCGLLMHALLEALQQSGVARADWRIVGVSIDPEDTPATARARREADLAYADFLLGEGAAPTTPDLHLLVAAPADAQHLAGQVGFIYSAQQATDLEAAMAARFAHPAAVIVATPHGHVSRYLTGIQFDASELKLALADAAGDRIAGISSRIALLCAHFDPRIGRHSSSVMNGLRALGLGLAVLLAGWCWRRRVPAGGMR